MGKKITFRIVVVFSKSKTKQNKKNAISNNNETLKYLDKISCTLTTVPQHVPPGALHW